MDALRIMACFMVVLLHTSDYFMQPSNFADFNVGTWKLACAYNVTTRWAVPVFVMISGVFMLKKDIPLTVLYKKYIWRLSLLLLLWNIIYKVQP